MPNRKMVSSMALPQKITSLATSPKNISSMTSLQDALMTSSTSILELNDKLKLRPRTHSHKTVEKVLSELPNVPERVVLSFSLSKNEDESFGITIVGGVGSLVNDIFIKTVSDSGVCGITDSLKVGDQILLINGRSLRGIYHDEAVNWFRQCKTHIDIVVSRMIESKPQKEKNRISPFHGRIISSSSDGWCEEPVVLEHKSIRKLNIYK